MNSFNKRRFIVLALLLLLAPATKSAFSQRIYVWQKMPFCDRAFFTQNKSSLFYKPAYVLKLKYEHDSTKLLNIVNQSFSQKKLPQDPYTSPQSGEMLASEAKRVQTIKELDKEAFDAFKKEYGEIDLAQNASSSTELLKPPESEKPEH